MMEPRSRTVEGPSREEGSTSDVRPLSAAEVSPVGVEGAEPLERLLRVEQVAEILNLSCKAVYALGARGVLPRVKVGRQVRWRPRDVRRFLRAAGEAGEE